MSLDVYLKEPKTIHNGQNIREKKIFHSNITHDLNVMAKEAGIYEALWRPYQLDSYYDLDENDYKGQGKFEQSCIVKAHQIIPLIEKGLTDLKARPDYFKQFSAENGWGTYEQFIPWIEEYLKALKENPDAFVEVDR